jgi:hypothetical protein
VSRRVAQLCTRLGVSNIRLVKKIEQTINSIQPIVSKYDDEVFQDVSSSLALFAWSHMQPGEAPTLDFLVSKKTESRFGIDSDETLTPQEAAWNALLNDYGYIWTDKLDVALIEGVMNGYFDPAAIEQLAKEFHDKIEVRKVGNKFEEAWRLYHDSFEDNQDAVLDAILDSFKSSFHQITPLNLDGTVRLMKKLGREKQAAEIIALYVGQRNERREFFDLSANLFFDTGADPDVAEAFRIRAATLKPKREVTEPPRDCRRPFCLSHAATAASVIMA